MKLEIGDLVLCPPSGPHAGPRIGKIKWLNKNRHGNLVFPVGVAYIDYPQEDAGWFSDSGAWVHPIRKIVIEETASDV